MYKVVIFKLFRFQVKAINTGADNVTLTSTCRVVITVQNVNDNPPQFLPPRVLVGNLVTESNQGTTVKIPENIQKGTVFMQLRTTDPDGEDNAEIKLGSCYPRMSTTSSNQAKHSKPVKPIFEIDSKSGKCRTTGILDRETIPAYICSVIAEDGEFSSGLSST